MSKAVGAKIRESPRDDKCGSMTSASLKGFVAGFIGFGDSHL